MVPDVASLLKAGERAELHGRGETIKKNINSTMDGVAGLKQLGVRELNYKLIFQAISVISVNRDLNQLEE